jgi:hypothetical protein
VNIHPRIAALLSAILIGGAVAYAFGSTLGGGLFMEDHFFLQQIHRVGGVTRVVEDLQGNWLGFIGYPYYRPLVTASFALDHALFDLAPWGYHLTNLLLHFSNALLVLILVRRLYPAGGRLGALAAALLFATHPVHPNAVGWVAARSDMLVGLGTLGMLVAYQAAWNSGRRIPLVAGVGLFALAILSKESGVVALALVCLLPAPVGWRRRLMTLLPAVILVTAYGAVHLAVVETGMNLQENAWPASLSAGVRLLAGQFLRVLEPTDSRSLFIALWPAILLLPALAAVIRRDGALALLFGGGALILGILPVVPILGNMDPALFPGYSRYWYLAVIGLTVLAALSVGGAGRFGFVFFLGFLVLAVLNAGTSRDRYDRDLGRPARMASAVAALVDREGGGIEHERINVFLRATGDRYAGVHVNQLAVTAAATRPFTSRDVPIYPLTRPELIELIRSHGGHRGFLVVTLDETTGQPVNPIAFEACPRWSGATEDGPYRLPVGLFKDIDGQGRSPLSFDVIRLEGVKGVGRLLLQIETENRVFALDRLADGVVTSLTYDFRRDDEFLLARSVSRVRLETHSRPDNPFKGVPEVDRIVFGDLETRRFLTAPAPGTSVSVWPIAPRLRFSEATPRELGFRLVTACGIYPPIGDHPLRPRDGIVEEARRRIAVSTNLGTGWFLVFCRPPAPSSLDGAPAFRMPLHPLRAAPVR